MLTEYEKMKLKLKCVELAQRQTMMIIATNPSNPDIPEVLEMSSEILDEAQADVQRLLSE